MRIAALDLGTNTFHLLIAENKTGVEFLLRKTVVVKLGKEGFNNGLISSAAFTRGINALKKFSGYIKKFKPDKTVALGTSALRKCKNGNDFIKEGGKIIGTRIEIIQGETEAALIYCGVKNSFDFGNKRVLIMDVGGGSVEFIIGTDKKILWKKSIEAGAARLLEIFSPSDPMNKKEKSAIEKYLKENFAGVITNIRKYKPQIMLGSSGSFDSLALMHAIKQNKRSAYKHNIAFEIPLREYFSLHRNLLSSTKQQRLKMKGLHRMRVDMMVPASMCIYFILKNSRIKKLYRSAYSLKEGIVFSEIKQGQH
jgi:exopolyphosphatase/guanosine-5'-triphosphate,3'-diphosphate pyrophosphatase